MFRAFFGGLTTGRLTRRPFLGYLLLLAVLFGLYGLGIAFGIGVMDGLLRGDLPAAGADLLGLDLSLLIPLALFMLAFSYAKLNLIAKRIRDMGLPGWRVLLIFGLADAGLAAAMQSGGESLSGIAQVQGMISGLMTVGLLFIPGGLFTPKAPPGLSET